MIAQKEIKELSEWLTNLIKAYEASKSPDLPGSAYKHSEVLVYTIDGYYDTYLSALADNKRKQNLQLDFILYLSARDWAWGDGLWPQVISVKQFLEWRQNIPEIKERWNTLQDLIDEIKNYSIPG